MLFLAASILTSGTSAIAQVNCDLTLKTTIEGFKVYKHNPSGAIMYKAKLYIDADGSPRAYGPNNSGLDYTANAGHPGNWWGVVTNSNGNPIIQGSGSPYPGLYVSTTSLMNSAYPSTSTSHYVNSEAIPFFVLPSAVTSLGGIHLGDVGYVYNTSTGLGCYAIFADGGPAGKLGEGSIYLANQIGVNSNARTGGTSAGIIDYIVFPNSGLGQGTIPTVAQINSMGAAKINTVGGTAIVGCLGGGSPPPSGCGTPSSLSANSISQTGATLNWTAVSGASSYNIQYKPSSSSTWTTTSSSSTSKALSGLTASTSYQFHVQAVCSSTGAYSSTSTFTTSSSTSSSSTLTIGNGTSSYSAHPYGTVYMDERVQYIITKSELTTAGWSTSSPYLKSIAFYVSSAASQSMGSFTMTISHISSSSFGSTSFLTGTNTTTVYSGTIAATAGWNTYHFSSSFAYNGTSNLLVSICWNNSSFTSNSTILSNSYSTAVALYYRADVSGGSVCGQSTGTQSYYRPNSKLEFSSSSQLAQFDNGGQRSLEAPLNTDIANETSFEVFPNPFDGNILNGKFSDASDKQMTVNIYDMLGREIFAREIFVEAGNFSLSLSNNDLQPGMYVFIAITNGIRYSKIVVVK